MTDRLSTNAAEGVLAANLDFYRAFEQRDLAAMESLWAAVAPVACIHPGWNALRGRDLVLASWRSILGNRDVPLVVCENASVHVFGETAFVICEEHVGHSMLIATNVFVHEHTRWKMVHHQSSPVSPDAYEFTRAPRRESGPVFN
jgi:ketosteroid isomerase-like protein